MYECRMFLNTYTTCVTESKLGTRNISDGFIQAVDFILGIVSLFFLNVGRGYCVRGSLFCVWTQLQSVWWPHINVSVGSTHRHTVPACLHRFDDRMNMEGTCFLLSRYLHQCNSIIPYYYLSASPDYLLFSFTRFSSNDCPILYFLFCYQQ
jgi:hypothetical protein